MRQLNWSEKKVIGEEQWWRVYELDDGTPIRVSKFLTDHIEISAEKLKKDWQAWTESERLGFVRAFGRKSSYSQEDERLLNFLMDAEDERIRESIATCLTRHSDKERAFEFLVHQLASGSTAKANYAHALGILGDSRAISALRGLHDQLAESIKETQGDLDDGVVLDFISCCAALKKLDGSSAYEDEIRDFLDHPNQAVRSFARVFLEGGPPSQ